MRAIEMVSRPSKSKTKQRNVAASQNGPMRDSAPMSNDRRQECTPPRPVVLDAFDKIILDDDYDDRNLGPT